MGTQTSPSFCQQLEAGVHTQWDHCDAIQERNGPAHELSQTRADFSRALKEYRGT